MKANCFKVLWGVVAILTRIQAFQGKLINHFDVQEKDAQTKGGAGNPVNVQALIRNTALIPCDLTPPLANDSVVLVVWYKDGNAPIYSFDVRGPYATMAKHWKSVNLEHRAFFRTMTDPATLSIDNISEVDEGEYRCRIDYQRAATRNYRARLTVIVPPSKPTILNENGKEVLDYAGPYEEGGDMKLKCMVTGGKPRPTIKWWREGKLLESTDGGHGDGGGGGGSGSGRSSQLVVRGLRRADQHAAFTCQAANNNISQPVSATASIEIYFRPLSVEILTSDNPFSAERKYEIPCQTFGSRPPAKIIWLLDNKELTAPKYNFTQTNSEDGNSSLSSLTFVPSRQDNDKTITCRATNHLVHSGTEEATIKLNVEYVPILHLSLGSNLNPEDIEEGDDVYFECKVNANPEAYKVLWKHNGQIMHGNQKNGVIMSASALVLQVVSRTQSGNYSCVASNVEGDGESNVVDLKIMYKPICRAEQKRVYGVARHEAAAVRCDVESYPPPDAFRWSFNNSAESTEVPPTKFTAAARHFSSVLTYAPVTELDYGTVMCWASNLAGRQQEPCIFHIIAAGKPDPLYNCSIINRSNESLEVECIAGFDGGQQQYFLLEVYDHKSGVLQTNLSSTFPLFVVSGLDPGKELKMVIYSANGKGRSDPVTLEGYTLKAAEKQTVLSLGTRDQLEFAPVLGILVGIVSALLLVTVVILAALRVRSGSRREGPRGALRPGFLPVKDKVNHPPLRLDQDDVFEKDDKNPDVIPSNKDSDYQLGSAVQTPGPNHVLSSSVAAPDYDTAAPTPQVMAHSPPPQSVTPLAEAYLARDRAYVPQHLSNEVIYAELSLSRPNSLDAAVKNGGQQYEPSTIYTQIDHARRPPPLLPPKTSPLLSPVTSLFPPKQGGLYHREVVTVRTPLMGCQQESCV